MHDRDIVLCTRNLHTVIDCTSIIITKKLPRRYVYTLMSEKHQLIAVSIKLLTTYTSLISSETHVTRAINTQGKVGFVRLKAALLTCALVLPEHPPAVSGAQHVKLQVNGTMMFFLKL